MKYPAVLDSKLVGTYDAYAHAGGGFTWDEVLEYRVWMHPERGAPDECEGNDYFYAFVTCEEALDFSESNAGAEAPLALVLQKQHISEPEPGVFVHVTNERITEWPVEFLSRPRRTEDTIPNFLAPDAPPNRLDIIRGNV
ncbi:MAG TPA: GCN5 family acetyltransferase [Planctomycetaceae bacterium]|nr:GCN5 family acetyltransferase [Planctomycetaceae bacterium]